MPTKIKICGITSLADAKRAVELGADALGFNFYAASPRYIRPGTAREIVLKLPAGLWCTGVFVNSSEEEVTQIAEEVGLNTLQFHGDETIEFIARFSKLRTIKALRLSEELSIKEIEQFLAKANYLLFDKYEAGIFGGTGNTIASAALEAIAKQGLIKQAFLAGGLTPANVRKRVEAYHPFGVDVASGVEQSPGIKDQRKMAAFVEEVRRAGERA